MSEQSKKARDQRVRALMKKFGVKAENTNSSVRFSYNDFEDHSIVFKKRVKRLFLLNMAGLLLCAVSLFFRLILPSDSFYMTTYNGHLYELPPAHESLESAVNANRRIEGRLYLINEEGKPILPESDDKK